MNSFPDVGFVVDIIPVLLVVALLFSLASLWATISARFLAQSSVLWAAGGVGASSGLLLIVLRGQIPDVASILWGNCILLLGHTLFSCGTSRFSGRAMVPDLILGVVAVLGFAALYFMQADVEKRIILYVVALLIFCIRMLYGFASVPRSFAVNVALAVLTFVCVLETIRLVLIFVQQLAWPDLAAMTGLIVRLGAFGALGVSVSVLVLNWPALRSLYATEPQSDVPDELAGIWRLAADRSALIAPNGSELRLTGNEYVVLQHLGLSDEPVNRLTLNSLIGRDTDNPKDRGIDILLSRLRKKCADVGVELPVTSVRGRGYVFHGDLPQS